MELINGWAELTIEKDWMLGKEKQKDTNIIFIQKKLNFNFQLYANFVSSKGKLFSRETIYLPLTSKLVHYEYNTNQIENIWFEVCRINIFPYLQNISEMAVL